MENMTKAQAIELLEWVNDCNNREVKSCLGCPAAKLFPNCSERVLPFAIAILKEEMEDNEKGSAE